MNGKKRCQEGSVENVNAKQNRGVVGQGQQAEVAALGLIGAAAGMGSWRRLIIERVGWVPHPPYAWLSVPTEAFPNSQIELSGPTTASVSRFILEPAISLQLCIPMLRLGRNRRALWFSRLFASTSSPEHRMCTHLSD
jgi:hypothetical protein